MKRVKFIIVALGLLAAQFVAAVTLPSTSYTPYAQGDDYSSSVTSPTGVTMVPSSYLQLGDFVYDWSAAETCATDYPGPENLSLCQNCVSGVEAGCEGMCTSYLKTDPGKYKECLEWCGQQNLHYQGDCGRSLPLDAPLWFMLVIAVLSVTLRAYARRVSQAA
ncbi:MAG: hypothetical protein J6U24_07820 [Paludibacteraceae bacterium]|nr:hypothetical protein [Paludibacteraceae bacterium]